MQRYTGRKELQALFETTQRIVPNMRYARRNEDCSVYGRRDGLVIADRYPRTSIVVHKSHIDTLSRRAARLLGVTGLGSLLIAVDEAHYRYNLPDDETGGCHTYMPRRCSFSAQDFEGRTARSHVVEEPPTTFHIPPDSFIYWGQTTSFDAIGGNLRTVQGITHRAYTALVAVIGGIRSGGGRSL